MRLTYVTKFMFAFALLFMSIGGLHEPLAANKPADSRSRASELLSPSRPLILSDLEAWTDGYLPFAMQREDIAGAVVVVVKDGKILFKKGYGYANVDKRIPVDPDATLFRPGSVSKLLTWTAVMQQVERGNIKLDQDINIYLDFVIPPFNGRPITMRNLMTHTAGFQDSLKDLLVTNSASPRPLGQFLKRQIPERISPPGEVPAYSNYGTALAGYIVQRVSGRSFDDYIEREIFEPLDMSQSSFRQPLPANLRPKMSKGYWLGSEKPKPYEVFSTVPAGSMASTGTDMAKFMIAHLQDGAYNDNRLMQPATVRIMHNSAFTTISSALNRMLLGFYEFNRNGRRIIGHDGDTRLFHSTLQLLPDENVGFFISLNSMGRDNGAFAVRSALAEGFVDRYFPGLAVTGSVSASVAGEHARMMVGNYDGSRRADTTFTSIFNLALQVSIASDENNRLYSPAIMGANGQPRIFEEASPFVWREVGGQMRLAAKVEGGKVVMWSVDPDSPSIVYTPTPIWRDASWIIPALGTSLLLIFLAIIGWPVGMLVRWHYGAAQTLQGRAAMSYRWFSAVGTAAALVMVGWLATVAYMATTFSVSSTIDPWILGLHILSIAVFPLAAVLSVWNLCMTFTTQSRTRNGIPWLWAAMLAGSSLTLLWVAIIYNFIGFNLAF
jgi:CubicO group peptidase (beta-lactamase class C family)